jgi:branched-chain amino acid transport system permease protein
VTRWRSQEVAPKAPRADQKLEQQVMASGLAAAFLRLPRSYAQRRATFDTPMKLAGLVLLVLVAVALPSLVSSYYVGVASVMLLAVPGAAALNAVQGVAGQVSAGNAALMAVGVFAAAFVLHEMPSMPFLLVLVFGGIAGGLVGVLIGIPAMRTRGLYLLIATLALQFIVEYVFEVYQQHTVGSAGFIFLNATIGSYAIDTTVRWYYVLLVAGALAIVVLKNWVGSRAGRSWFAIRHSEATASILGIDVARTKVAVFVASSALIGIQGVIFAYYTGVVQYNTLTFAVAIQYIAIVIIGGQASVLGVVFGVIFVEGLPYLLQYFGSHIPSWFPDQSLFQQHVYDLQDVIYGFFIIIFLLYAPRGLVEIWERLGMRIRLRALRQELRIEPGESLRGREGRA